MFLFQELLIFLFSLLYPLLYQQSQEFRTKVRCRCILLRELQKLLFGSQVFSIREHLPFVYTGLNNVKVMTTPLALIITGAQFRFSAVKGMFKEIAVGTLWRIVFAPIIGLSAALLLQRVGMLQCGTGEMATLVALFGAPAAVSGAVMAGEMGNDEQLATQYVVWTSICSRCNSI